MWAVRAVRAVRAAGVGHGARKTLLFGAAVRAVRAYRSGGGEAVWAVRAVRAAGVGMTGACKTLLFMAGALQGKCER